MAVPLLTEDQLRAEAYLDSLERRDAFARAAHQALAAPAWSEERLYRQWRAVLP